MTCLKICKLATVGGIEVLMIFRKHEMQIKDGGKKKSDVRLISRKTIFSSQRNSISRKNTEITLLGKLQKKWIKCK